MMLCIVDIKILYRVLEGCQQIANYYVCSFKDLEIVLLLHTVDIRTLNFKGSSSTFRFTNKTLHCSLIILNST